MNDNPLLELIPREGLFTQKGFKLGYRADYLPMFRLLREPTHLEEFDWVTNRDIVIWRDNETVICVCDKPSLQFEEARYVSFLIDRVSQRRLNCAIYGTSDVTIAETVTWFWSLPHSDSVKNLITGSHLSHDERRNFSFAALSTAQLAHILDSNPTRSVSFTASWLTTQQLVILATRPHPLNLRLTSERRARGIKDDGTAFVDELGKRQSSFGSLDINCLKDALLMSQSNLERLLKLDYIIDELRLGLLSDEMALLPFAAKVNTLVYSIKAKDLSPEDFESLDMVMKELKLQISAEGTTWHFLLASILNRITGLSHFERLSFLFDKDIFWHLSRVSNADQVVVPAIINAVNGNSNLSYLNMGNIPSLFDTDACMEAVFEAMEEHPGLRTVVLHTYPPGYYSNAEDNSEDPREWDYSSLERLLSRNRRITVCDYHGRKFSNGSSIDKLYALNSFFNGSAKVLEETQVLRLVFVATALTESASQNVQYTSLLLSNHTDMLCEFLQTSMSMTRFSLQDE
ncbi:hypothetical protein FisN_10Hh407 [Fistulifera solaris]|uniref:Uncharacterized protein n=1 Tax=Fistulifera solaris TaxID=1519565 RepID=A0A1Z5JRK3_FISSO|nr:hypothetical protein FisN_10Hh407 [Fistulifera solaris]|eukprot:GAX16378.1 hypothetical protein FisN_10Hh407 [Fistulifera solaris]